VAVEIRWSATLPGDARHLLSIDPSGAHLYAGDGWGVSYASLSLRLIDMKNGTELARRRTKYQQPRSITYRGPDLLLATDSRLFQLSQSDLGVRRTWEHAVPRFADALELESDSLLMTNWMRPTVSIFDLTTGRSKRLLLDAGLRPLRTPDRLAIYALRSGLFRSIDIAARSSQLILKGVAGLSVALAGRRWLAVLAGSWARAGGADQPAGETRELVVYDLNLGTARKKTLSRETLAVEAARGSSILWLVQRAPGPRVLPSIVERMDAQTCETIDTIAAPRGNDVVRVIADRSVVFFGQPLYQDRQAVITCGIVS